MVINGVTAHRGDSGNSPENTLEAFESAIALGVDWIETDIRMTKDNQLVVMHDSHLGRVTGVNAKVRELDLKEIQTLRVSSEHHTIPTLAETFECIRDSNTRISLQPKADCVPQIVALAQVMSIVDQIGFNDHDIQKMTTAKLLLQNTTIFWDRINTDTLDEDLEIASNHHFHALVIYEPELQQSHVNKIHSAGLKAGVWTVNDPARLAELLNWGVDRIYTDVPGVLIQLIDEKH